MRQRVYCSRFGHIALYTPLPPSRSIVLFCPFCFRPPARCLRLSRLPSKEILLVDVASSLEPSPFHRRSLSLSGAAKRFLFEKLFLLLLSLARTKVSAPVQRTVRRPPKNITDRVAERDDALYLPLLSLGDVRIYPLLVTRRADLAATSGGGFNGTSVGGNATFVSLRAVHFAPAARIACRRQVCGHAVNDDDDDGRRGACVHTRIRSLISRRRLPSFRARSTAFTSSGRRSHLHRNRVDWRDSSVARLSFAQSDKASSIVSSFFSSSSSSRYWLQASLRPMPQRHSTITTCTKSAAVAGQTAPIGEYLRVRLERQRQRKLIHNWHDAQM